MTAAGLPIYLAILCGLAFRRRLNSCYSFGGYLAAVAISDALMLLWPDQFYRQSFWVAKELLIALCRFALAAELSYRIFRAFPGARATARGVLLLVLSVTLAMVAAGSRNLAPAQESSPIAPLISQLQPRLLNGTIWLLTAIAVVVLWYRLPVHPFHKAILSGYVPYLLVFATGLSFLESAGWKMRAHVDYVDATAYMLLLAYWTAAAWRKADPPTGASGSLRVLERATG